MKLKPESLEKMNRYLGQETKAISQLKNAKSLYDFIDAVKYAYGFTMRYKNANLLDIIVESTGGWFQEPTGYLKKCLDSGILKPWKNTYYFDKEKANSLQDFILDCVDENED